MSAVERIPVRKLNIDLSTGFPRHWLGGDAFRTQLFNAMSMSFPIGEQFFIDSVRAAMPHIQDPVLLQQIRGFIGQEATHRHLHGQFNEQLFRQGLRYVMEPWVQARIRGSRRVSLRSNLCVTMAYEHFTAILSDVVLGSAHMEDAAEPLRTLWEWHAVEETEHKSVAFDAYQALGGGYWLRVSWYAYVWLLFLTDTLVQTTHNLYRDGSLFKLSTGWNMLKYLFGRRGLVWSFMPQALSYFRPRFTPWERDNGELALRWLDKSKASYREIGKDGGNDPGSASSQAEAA
jgi:predicted metal-dependent hydrolase